MSATTEPKRQPKKDPGGGKYKRNWTLFIICGSVFAVTWFIWTFYFGAAIPN